MWSRTAAAESTRARAATGVDELVRAAYQGRIDTLLLAEDDTVWGRYTEATDDITTDATFEATGEDLLEAVAVQTLQHDGAVHLLSPKEMSHRPAAAILRF